MLMSKEVCLYNTPKFYIGFWSKGDNPSVRFWNYIKASILYLILTTNHTGIFAMSIVVARSPPVRTTFI